VKLSAAILEQPLAYRLWQVPFAEKKFEPVLAHNDLSRVRRVLDVGCGPGTNTHHFPDAEYLGIDINERYIVDARRRHRRNFLVSDVTAYTAAPEERYDFIFLNSFLHHIDTPNSNRILAHLSSLLTEDGHVHILDLVLPKGRTLARLLAHWDRGKFCRLPEEWKEIFSAIFEPVVFEPFVLSGLGLTLWEMVYFKGRAKR